jgi:hypothetical protein
MAVTSYSSTREDRTLYRVRRRRHTHNSFYLCLRPRQRLLLTLTGVCIAATISIVAATTGTYAPVEQDQSVPQSIPTEVEAFIPNPPSIEASTLEVKGASAQVSSEPPPMMVEEESVQVFDIALSVELQQYTYEVADSYGVKEYYPLILSLMWVESRYRTDSISKSSDYGIMQINKCNHSWLREELGITDFLDPEQNIQAGIRILSEYLITYNDEHRALMAYNMGVSGAKRQWNKGNYTSSYSRKVMNALDELLTTNCITE